MRIIATALLAVLALTGCDQLSGKPRVIVTITGSYSNIFWSNMHIQAAREDMVVNNIVINKGNCVIKERDLKTDPLVIKYGDTEYVPFTNAQPTTPCNILEADLDTSIGSIHLDFTKG